MHVILDDLRAEGRVGEWECRRHKWERGWMGDGCALTLTRQSGREEYLSLLPVYLSTYNFPTYLTVAQTRTKLQGTDRHITHTNMHEAGTATLEAWPLVWLPVPLNPGGAPNSLSAPLAPSPLLDSREESSQNNKGDSGIGTATPMSAAAMHCNCNCNGDGDGRRAAERNEGRHVRPHAIWLFVSSSHLIFSGR